MRQGSDKTWGNYIDQRWPSFLIWFMYAWRSRTKSHWPRLVYYYAEANEVRQPVGHNIGQLILVVVAELAYHASKFQIECTCPPGKWIVKITCPNVPFTCLKYIKPMQLMWKSEIRSRLSDKSCRYSTCSTVIFTRLRRSDEWNFEPCILLLSKIKIIQFPD